MQSTDQPDQVQVPFADTGTKRPIPIPSQIGITDGAASYTDGFPPKTFLPLAVGGVPPAGADFNGILFLITEMQRWLSAGGLFKFDAAFAGVVTGYPKGARIMSNDTTDVYVSTVEGNVTDPNGGGSVGWISARAFLQAGLSAVYRPTQTKLREVDVSPEDFGAIGDGIANDTVPVAAAFATGKMVNGNGKTYKVVGSNVIDASATLGVGYGVSKAWFSAGICRDINFIGDVSFGPSGSNFLGKHQRIENVLVTGDARFSSWYTRYHGIRVTGTAYFGGDFPPATNFFGCYYNEWHCCDFVAAVVDQRYGPFNQNGFFYTQFDTFHVLDTGNVGYGGGTLPSKDFHMNAFYGCEWFTAVGLLAPDGFYYPFVIEDTASVGGSNKVTLPYMETAVTGFYGSGIEIDTIHGSGNAFTMGGGQIGYNAPISGECGQIARDVPNIYPAGNMLVGGDWSILDTTGKPYCLTSSGHTVTFGADTQEPTGLSKFVQFAGAAGAVVNINFGAADAANRTLRSFSAVYKITVGSVIWETQDAAGATISGASNITRLANGWVMVSGHTHGFARMNSGGSYTVKVSAVSGGRGAGTVAPVTNQPGGLPLLDLSGAASLIKNFLNASADGGYNNQNAKVMGSGSGNVDFFTVTLPNFSGQSYIIRVNFSVHSGGTGSRQFYRESLIQINGAGTLVETNVHAINGANATLSFVLGAAGLLTVRTTCAGTAETAQMAMQLLGYGVTTPGAPIVAAL